MKDHQAAAIIFAICNVTQQARLTLLDLSDDQRRDLTVDDWELAYKLLEDAKHFAPQE